MPILYLPEIIGQNISLSTVRYSRCRLVRLHTCVNDTSSNVEILCIFKIELLPVDRSATAFGDTEQERSPKEAYEVILLRDNLPCPNRVNLEIHARLDHATPSLLFFRFRMPGGMKFLSEYDT